MNLVVIAADAFSFLLAWEFMSLSSWGLVVAQPASPIASNATTMAVGRWRGVGRLIRAPAGRFGKDFAGHWQ